MNEMSKEGRTWGMERREGIVVHEGKEGKRGREMDRKIEMIGRNNII